MAADAGKAARDNVLGLERAAAIGVEDFGDRFRHGLIDWDGCPPRFALNHGIIWVFRTGEMVRPRPPGLTAQVYREPAGVPNVPPTGHFAALLPCPLVIRRCAPPLLRSCR